jgi:DNA-binding transcriptional LysR family regulator
MLDGAEYPVILPGGCGAVAGGVECASSSSLSRVSSDRRHRGRHQRGVAPTALGTRILPHLQNVLASIDKVLADARAASGPTSQPLRMGVSPLIHPGLIARALQAARQNPPAALTLKEDDLANLRADLRSRQLDLILVPTIPTAENYQRLHIDSEPIHYLPKPSEANAKSGQPIELSELSHHQLVMVGDACGLTTFIRTLFEVNNTELTRYPGQADSYRSLEEWTRLEFGSALMPKSRFQDDQRTRPLHHHGAPVTIDYEAVWLVGSTQTAAIDMLLAAITDATL